MILTVCLNPTLQKTLSFSSIKIGEVNRTCEHRFDASGKGINVTRVLTQLGKNALHLTQLGSELRPLFLSLCRQDGIPVEWAESSSRIRFCYTIISGTDVTELVEEAEPVGKDTEEKLLEKFNTIINDSDYSTLIISGTKAAGFSDNVIPDMAGRAKEKNMRIILDIKGNDLISCLQYQPDIIKPNLHEFAGTFNIDKDDNAAIKAAMTDICVKYRTCVIITDGSRCIRAAENGNYSEIKIPVIKTGNTTGCGDAFTAGLVSALEDGKSFYDAIAEGIRCGSLNAGFIKPGVIK